VVIKRSSSAEVARLIDALLTSAPEGREAAAARLAIVGPRGMDRLVATLQGVRNPAHTAAILDVLERIGDPRAAALVSPLLAHPSTDVAIAAVAVVRRALQAGNAEVAARATDELIALATRDITPLQVRSAALDALNDLPADVLAPLSSRLRLPERAPAGVAAASPSSEQPLEKWVDDASAPMREPAEVQAALGAARAGAPLPLLHRLVGRLRALERESHDERQREWRTLRGAVHQVLAERGSRVALYDLRESLERDPEALPLSMLAALRDLADSSCVEPIADAWARSADPWLRDQLRDVLQASITREALTRRHAPVRRASARHPDLFASISMPSRTRP
jgi:hypothetical protein